jgi:hypothetical protein
MRSSISSSKRRLALILAAAALAGVGIEAAISIIGPLLDSTILVYKSKLEWIRTPAIAPDILILGDSEAYAGIAPEVIETRLGEGVSCRNAAFAGMPPRGVWHFYKKWTAAGKCPRVLILSFSPMILGHDYGEFQYNFFLTANEVLSLPGLSFPARINALAAHIFPSWRLRTTIRSAFSPSLGVSLILRQVKILLSLQEWDICRDVILRRGWRKSAIVFPPKAIEKADESAATFRYANVMFHGDAPIVKMNASYIDSIIDLANARSCKVVIAPTPMPYYADTLRTRSGTNRRFGEFLDGIKMRHPAAAIAEPHVRSWDNQYFMNVNHLNESGAGRFSVELAEYLRRHTLL